MHRILSIVALVSVTMCIPADEPKREKADTSVGVITAVDAAVGTMTAKVGNDGPVSRDFTFLRDTKVTLEGKDGKLTDLKVGMRVEITTKKGGEEVVAIEIQAKTQKARIASVDVANSTIKLLVEGKADPLAVAKDAKIFLDGREIKLGDVPANVAAVLKFNSAGNEIVQLEATQGRPDRGLVQGAFRNADATTGQLVLAVKAEGGRSIETTYVLDKEVVVVRGREPMKLAELKAGDEVILGLSDDKKIVKRITLAIRDGEKK